MLQDPRHQRGRGGLPVGPGNRKHPAVVQHRTRQPFGPRHVGKAALEQLFDDRLPAGHDIAYDDNVGRGFELRGIEALDHLDAQCRELRAHGRIDVAIGAGDAMTGRARDGGDAAHERAADA